MRVLFMVAKEMTTKQCISNVAFYASTENVTKHSGAISFGLEEIQSPHKSNISLYHV